VTVLNQNDSIVGGTEAHFFDQTSLTQFTFRDLFETRYDACTGCNSEQLDFNTADPSYSWKSILVEQVICLIVKAPLAENNIGA
jgi:hypothetical protein